MGDEERRAAFEAGVLLGLKAGRAAADFERTMRDVQATIDGAPGALERLREAARADLSAREPVPRVPGPSSDGESL